MTENEARINGAALVIMTSFGDTELNDRHIKIASALDDAHQLIERKVDLVGRRTLNLVIEFDGVRSGNLMFDDAGSLAEHLLQAVYSS
jgi:hypothetical protein